MENEFPHTIGKKKADECEQSALKLEKSYRFLEAASLYLQAAEYYMPCDTDKAIYLYYKSNRCLEKTEYPRVVPSLWEVVGNMLSMSENAELKFSTDHYKEQNELFHIISDETWDNIHGHYANERCKITHRQAWSYMWAAERFDYYSDHKRALPLYRRAALAWSNCDWPKDSEFNKWYLVGRNYAGACYSSACISGNLSEKYELKEIGLESSDQSKLFDDYTEMKNAFSKGYLFDDGKEKISKHRHNVMIKIENKLKDFGNIIEADQVYSDRMDCRRKEYLKKCKLHRWLFLSLWMILTKYGTSPIRFIFFLIMTFGLVFPSLFKYFKAVESTSGNPETVSDFSICLYFSIITATTLGYGDYHPIGIGIYISIVEVVFGLVFFGFLLQMFIRRIR